MYIMKKKSDQIERNFDGEKISRTLYNIFCHQSSSCIAT